MEPIQSEAVASSPSLSLAGLTLPAPVETLFGRAAPFVLEVGFGDGRFTAHLAHEHPHWNVLGAEVSLASMTRAIKRMQREGLTNVRLWRGNARFIVRNLAGPRSLHRVYVNFPDPWPRKRHHKNRLLQPDFFRLLSTRLEDGGALHLTTDHAEYFAFACDSAAASSVMHTEVGPPPPATLQTKYALKWQAEQRPIYHAVFTKADEAEPHPPLIHTEPMQHALLDGDLADVQAFQRELHAYRDGHIVLLDVSRTLGQDRLLFQVLINEKGGLRQEVLIEARAKSEGGILVTMLPFGSPLSTRGGREAVSAVANWLETQGLTIVDRWC